MLPNLENVPNNRDALNVASKAPKSQLPDQIQLQSHVQFHPLHLVLTDRKTVKFDKV